MNIAVILAGGSGKRLGGNTPKQFIRVLGKPILVYTMEKFQNSSNIDYIEVVCQKENMEYVHSLVKQYKLTKTRWYAEGGQTFQESTMNGLFRLKGEAAPDDIVLITFGVSPMITDEIIDDSIAVCRKNGNAVAADEMIMCTCVKDDAYSSSKSVLRETLVGLNTPWTFHFGEVCRMYEDAMKAGTLDKMEPHTTSLYLEAGKKLYFSKSSTGNIKITHAEDLELFEGYLLVQKQKKQRQENNE